MSRKCVPWETSFCMCTDGQTDVMNLIDALSNFAKMPENDQCFIKFYSHQLMHFFIQLCISLLSNIKIT